jgi:hypothetical protein
VRVLAARSSVLQRALERSTPRRAIEAVDATIAIVVVSRHGGGYIQAPPLQATIFSGTKTEKSGAAAGPVDL